MEHCGAYLIDLIVHFPHDPNRPTDAYQLLIRTATEQTLDRLFGKVEQMDCSLIGCTTMISVRCGADDAEFIIWPLDQLEDHVRYSLEDALFQQVGPIMVDNVSVTHSFSSV